MKKVFAKLRMKQKIMFVSISGIILTALVLGLLFFKVTEKMFVEKVSSITQETIVQNTKYIDNELGHILQLIHTNLIGYDISYWVSKYGQDTSNSVSIDFQLQQMLTQLCIQNEFIHSAYLVVDDRIVTNLNQTVEYDVRSLIVKTKEQNLAYWSDAIIEGESKQIELLPLVITVPLNSNTDYYISENTPRLVVNISYRKIDKVLKELEKQVFGKVYLLNADKQVFENLDIPSNNSEHLIQENRVEISGWYIQCIQEKKVLYSDFYESQITLVFYMLILILIFGVVSTYIAKTITEPLQKLTLYAKELEQQKYDRKIKLFGKDEITELGKAFNSLSREMQRYSKMVEEDKIRIRNEEKAKRRIELELLQAQLNPHFLYNTLDSLYWYSVTNKNNQISNIILNLSRLLRIGLNKGCQKIPLKTEVNHVLSYLKIQKEIFGDKFMYRVLFDEALSEYSVVKILLQPLVENSILHGFKDIEEGGEIVVNVFRENELIILQVEDNGCGFTEESLAKMSEKKHSGFAFNNVLERLILNYGKNASLQWESEPYVKTKVLISIPMDKVL